MSARLAEAPGTALINLTVALSCPTCHQHEERSLRVIPGAALKGRHQCHWSRWELWWEDPT